MANSQNIEQQPTECEHKYFHFGTEQPLRRCVNCNKLEQQPAEEPVAFQIFKPTPPRLAIPNVRDAELPWVYDQDPSSGNVASMWVTPVARPQPAAPKEKP